jgi:hypothetical protein
MPSAASVPEDAARLWNFSNPGWSGNVPAG